MKQLALCLVLLALGLSAQATPSPARTPAEGSTRPAGYRLMAGDVIDVVVSTHKGYDRTVTVQPDGRIQFPRVGEIAAAGLTTAQLAARLQKGLNVQLVDPQVTVSLKERAPTTVLVLGDVVKPGSYELKGEMRLLDALSQAGGPTPKADLHRITLTHAGQTGKEVLDLQDLLTKGQQENLSSNVPLRPGDTVVLPESDRKFYVLGEVNKADAFPLKGNDRLLDAITTAGGPTHEADLAKVVLVRKDQNGKPVAQRIDLKQMMQRGDMARNESLREGDVVFVPNRKPKQPITSFLSFLWPVSSLLNALR